MTAGLSLPAFRPIADTGVLVEFADHIDDNIHQRVLDLDAAIHEATIHDAALQSDAQPEAPNGITELIPAYSALFVGYDPLITDYENVTQYISTLLNVSSSNTLQPNHWQIPVCYDLDFAPDLPELCATLKLSAEEIIAHHTAGVYKVYMYGFAPGYAYLGGVPERIHVPRKAAPVMNIPTGSVMIAGPQSLITTVVMPSGWWVIGRTAKTPLQAGSDHPFLFSVGDTLEFTAISKQEFIDHTDKGSTTNDLQVTDPASNPVIDSKK